MIQNRPGIGMCQGSPTVHAQGVQRVYRELLAKMGSEMYILREASLAEIKAMAGSILAEGIRRVREGKVNIEPGYDGEYGVIKIYQPQERETAKEQLVLF